MPASLDSLPAIAIILPRREGFNASSFGAISLTVRDFTEHSLYREHSHIFGAATAEGFPGLHYLPQTENKRWWQSNTQAYANACLVELARLRPALIEIHNRPVLVRLMENKISTAMALHLHNDPQEMKGAQTPTERKRLLERCTAIYCVSEYIRERFMEDLSTGRKKVHVIYNGLAIPEKLPPKRRNIVFAGRLTPEKGVLEFASALADVLPQHPSWSGTIIGGKHHRASHQLSAYEKKIASIAERLHTQVDFAGFRSHEDTMQAFARAEIAVVPSLWHEAFGRTALEAMANGCALISSGRGGLQEITGEDAALTVPNITAVTLGNALTTLIKNDTLRQQFQHSGYARAQKFSIARCTQALDTARAQILGNNHPILTGMMS